VVCCLCDGPNNVERKNQQKKFSHASMKVSHMRGEKIMFYQFGNMDAKYRDVSTGLLVR
jgi:hypothetical protein